MSTARPSVRIAGGPLTSWSFSRWNVHSGDEGCGYRAGLKFINKLPEPQGLALARGDMIDKACSAYVLGTADRLIPELKTFAVELKGLRALRKRDPAAVTVNETWAFRRDWSHTVYNDWDGCWLRVKVDISWRPPDRPGVLRIVDIKSGKRRPEKEAEYMLQLDLYGTSGLAWFPDVDRAEPELWYTDQDEFVESPRTYDRASYPVLVKEWETRVKPMLNDRRFVPRPSSGCRWCHFTASKGGPCVY